MSTMTLFNASKNRLIEADVREEKVLLNIGSPQGNFINKAITISEWNDYLRDKKEHGYKEIETTITKKEVKLHPVLAGLRDISRQIIEKNYKFTITPTKENIDKAKALLIDLSKEKNLIKFNETLYKIFELIPRKMKNPILFTAKNKDDFVDILDRENTLLSNLESFDDSDESEDNNISFRDCTEREVEEIKDHLDGHTKGLFYKAYAVSNKTSDSAFEAYKKEHGISKTTYLYHGSRNENWYSIIKTGLSCNPVNVFIAGKMFGNGIYFAPKAIKSRGYTSLLGARHAGDTKSYGYIAVYEVATGKEYISPDWTPSLTELNERKFRKEYNCDSYHAIAGKNLLEDEVIVYNNAACRIKYLIELR